MTVSGSNNKEMAHRPHRATSHDRDPNPSPRGEGSTTRLPRYLPRPRSSTTRNRAHRDRSLVVEFHTGQLFHPVPNFRNAAGLGRRGRTPALHHPVSGAGHHTLPVGMEGRAEDGVGVV